LSQSGSSPSGGAASPRAAPSPAAGRVERLLTRHAALSARRPWLLALLGLLCLLVSLPAAVRLYADLRTDLRELLPRGAPAAAALDALDKRIGGNAHLSVIVETADLHAGERFADALAGKLRSLVPDPIREIRYRVDDDRAYLEAHGALYADLKDLTELDDGLREAKQKASPFELGLDDDPAEAPQSPKIADVSKKLREAIDREDHYIDGYLAGDGGKALVLIITPSRAALSLEDDLRLYHAVDAEVQALSPASFHPSIRVGYDGEVREVLEAQEHLVQDLALSSVLVLTAVIAVIVVFFRSFRALLVLGAPVFAGAAVTFAAGRLAIGYLNPNTAFLGSILLGNGINAGIILLARYLEERRRGVAVESALPRSLITTWRATLTASGAAAVSYACLGVTGFRGFNQFAFIGGVGMVIVWLATYAFVPPILVLFERRRSLVGAAPKPSGALAAPFSRALGRWATPVTALCGAIVVASAALVLRFAADPIEYDFTNLGSRRGAVDGAAYWGKRLDAVMQSYLTPTVILTDSAEKANAVASAIRAEQKARGEASAIDRVATLADLLPSDQDKKLPVLRSILGQLNSRVVKALPEADRPFVERLRQKTELREVTLDDLPEHVSRLVREKDGSSGKLVLVYPTLGATAKHGRVQVAFADDIRRIALKADPGAQVAGSLILMADIVRAITHDGFFAAMLSFAAVGLLTAIVLRSARSAAWVVGSLALGTLWMGGALGALGLKMNFVNFAVLPITFGIGIDYAVNLYERYRENAPAPDAAERAVATSGGAVTLCSLTTIIGYSSLLIADNLAIFSFGLTAVIGEIACLSAALVALPALLMVTRGRQREPEEQERAAA
jgi:uncharacterized protein